MVRHLRLDVLFAALLAAVVCVPANAMELTPEQEAVRQTYVKNRVPPYPNLLRRAGVEGTVMLRVRLAKNGKILDMEVKQSPHPLLEQVTVDAVLDWRFSPALQDGEPIEAWVVVPVKYSLKKTEQAGKEDKLGAGGLTFARHDQSRLPAEFRYEHPITVKVAVGAVYPLKLLHKRTAGSATVQAMVGTDGRVWETKVVESTHPEFSHAAKAMIEAWEFEPARRSDGSPAPYVLEVTRTFNLQESDVYVLPIPMDLLQNRPIVYSSDQLDAMPRVRFRPLPVYPVELRKEGVQETVLVEFVVDEKGAVFLPQPVKYRNAALGWAAATAVARWRLEPPMKDGKPVYARLRVPIVFSLQQPTP